MKGQITDHVPTNMGALKLENVDEIHLKFYVPKDPWRIPRECEFLHQMPKELERRARLHFESPGDNFIRQARGISPIGAGDQLIEAGFGFKEWYWEKRQTLHKGRQIQKQKGRHVEMVIVNCIFARGNSEKDWCDAMITGLIDQGSSWVGHFWDNPASEDGKRRMCTINLVYPEMNPAGGKISADGGKLTLVPIEW